MPILAEPLPLTVGDVVQIVIHDHAEGWLGVPRMGALEHLTGTDAVPDGESVRRTTRCGATPFWIPISRPATR